MKILYVVNEASFFLSHRLPLGLEALRRGHEVVVVTAPDTGEGDLDQYGFRYMPVSMTRSGFTLSQEFAAYRQLKQIYRRERPDLVHHVTIKPVIFGSFAARAAAVPAVVNAVPGMGSVYTRRGAGAAVVRYLVNMLYLLAFARMHMRVIFQNSEDMREFISHGILQKEQAVLIRGSGVDLMQFPVREQEAPPPLVFVLVARMLREKGVVEFAQAAKKVKQSHPEWRFLLAGDADPGNPTSLTETELQALARDYGIERLGHVSDIPALLAASHVVCLPSYREGVPKTLLEASAAGLPMIASDIAGCREVVKEEVTGMLVPARDSAPLAQAMLRMGEDGDLRRRCGRAARAKAEAVFSVDDVVEHTFRVYDELLTDA